MRKFFNGRGVENVCVLRRGGRMTRQERDILKYTIEQIKDILRDFEKYYISQEDAIVRIRVALLYLEKHMVGVEE